MQPMPTFQRSLFALALLALAAAPCVAQSTEFGATDFPNSGAEAAQPAFLRGLLLLHSFEYEDARSYFKEAQRADPAFAMAYWGEAMTHNHPVWMRQDRDAATEALARLGATAAERRQRAATPRERDYLATLDVLFGTEATATLGKEERDDAYAAAMRDLASRYPSDLDAQAFYALSLLGTTHEGRDFGTYMEAAAVVEDVFAANPRHPGAAHYLIHAYDDPVHAPLGVRPARVYADLAPSASHALHMPSHIFFALGQWAPASRSNEDAYRAAYDRSVRLGGGLGGHGYHALLWLGYSYLQEGRMAEAAEIVGRADSLYRAEGTSRSAHTLTWLRAHMLVETQDADAAQLGRFPKGEHGASMEAVESFARGYAGYLAEDRDEVERARAALAAIDTDGASGRTGATVSLLAMQAEALWYALGGEEAEALELLRAATELEHAQPIAFGPAVPPKPSAELLGDLLLRVGAYEDAAAAYQRVAERAPNRRLAQHGLRDAAAGMSRSALE